MKSLKQPAATLSKGADNTERMDLSQTLQEIDSVELSLDVEHVERLWIQGARKGCMRIRDFENCVSMTMPNFGYSFLIHRAFHSVATAPETLAKASPSATVEKQLTGVEQLRQAFQILTVAARVTAVFGLHKRPFSTYRMDGPRFCSRLGLLPHIPPNVDAAQLWLQLLPQDRRLSGSHTLGHAHFFSAICDWYIDVTKRHLDAVASSNLRELSQLRIPSFRDIASMSDSKTLSQLSPRGETRTNGQALSPREIRMQKTYSELFKLQNLLEKTVRNVAASNNLKSVGSSEPPSAAVHSGKQSREAAGSGRPYYPGSPVKVEARDSASQQQAAADSTPRSAKMAKKHSSAVQSSEESHDARNFRVKAPTRPQMKSPKQLKTESAREASQRFQRMNELWGSPDGQWGSGGLSPLSGDLSRNYHEIRVKRTVGNEGQLRAGDKVQPDGIRVMMSPQTPTFPAASLIPHVTSPSVALHVLQAAHANMTSAISDGSLPSKPFKENPNASISRNKSSHSAAAVGSPGKQNKSASTSVPTASPSANNVMKAQSLSLPASKATTSVTPSAEADRQRESFSNKRISEEILSSEEQELKLCTFAPLISPKPQSRPTSAPLLKAPGFDDVVMRLQRGKLERERQKHIAEHAFDYTAPPAPKNIQAISQLALPTSSRVSNAKTKSATTVRQNVSGEGRKASVGLRGEMRNIDGNQSQPARPSSGTQHSTQHHMSPAVAAALAKYQVTQGALAQAVVPAKMEAEKFEIGDKQLDQDSMLSQYFPSSDLSHVSATALQRDQVENEEHRAKSISSLHSRNKHLLGRVAGETTTVIEASLEQDMLDSLIEIENEQQTLSTSTSTSKDADSGKVAHVVPNSLQQFVMLLNFDDNRYGDDDIDRGASPTLQSRMKTLPNAEIGGSGSLEEFTISSREILPSDSPKDFKSVPLQLKVPLCDTSKEIIQLETDQHMAKRSISRRAAARFYEAVVGDVDVLRRLSPLMSDMEQWMAANNDHDSIRSFAVWSDRIAKELLDIRHLSNDIMELLHSGHAAIVHSLNVSLHRAAARDIDGCVSISYGYSQPNESFAHKILSVALKHAMAIELFEDIKFGAFNAEKIHGDVDNEPHAAILYKLGIIQKSSSSDFAAREYKSKFVMTHTTLPLYFAYSVSCNHSHQHVLLLCESIANGSLGDEEFAVWVMSL